MARALRLLISLLFFVSACNRQEMELHQSNDLRIGGKLSSLVPIVAESIIPDSRLMDATTAAVQFTDQALSSQASFATRIDVSEPSNRSYRFALYFFRVGDFNFILMPCVFRAEGAEGRMVLHSLSDQSGRDRVRIDFSPDGDRINPPEQGVPDFVSTLADSGGEAAPLQIFIDELLFRPEESAISYGWTPVGRHY